MKFNDIDESTRYQILLAKALKLVDDPELDAKTLLWALAERRPVLNRFLPLVQPRPERPYLRLAVQDGD